MRRHVSTALFVVLAIAFAAAPAGAQIEEDEAAAQAYREAVAGLATQVADAAAEAQTVNTAWEGDELTFNETLAALQGIESTVSGVVAGLRDLIPPVSLEAQHAGAITTAENLALAATAMVDGLRSSDTGQARRAALATFTDDAITFTDLATLVGATGATPTTTAAATTAAQPESTADTATTSTSLAPATTSAALPPATPLVTDESSGSSPTVLVGIAALVVGALLGAAGGLMVGRRARIELLVALQRERSRM